MPSRISGACNGCRTKKQKCSGDRSGCTQCSSAGIVCTWPEQRKRGPAKGYIEGLEHRLHEAESLLLQLLPLVSSEQLSAATAGTTDLDSHTNNMSRDARNSQDLQNQSSPPMLNKKIGIEYWETFPLDSVENIRRWQQDCAIHGKFRDDGGSRPGSVDLMRESGGSKKASNVTPNTMSQFRTLSTDSFGVQDGYSLQTTSSQPPQQRQQNWTNSASVGLYGETSLNGARTIDSSSRSGALLMQKFDDNHSWTTRNSLGNLDVGQPAHKDGARAMDLDVDNSDGLFSNDVQRRLFW